MALDHAFAREEIFPSWFANRIQDYLSAANTSLYLSASTTAVAVIPDAAIGIAALSLAGRWRWIEGEISRSHPGGAEGIYNVYAVAEDNDVDNSPDPFTDHTNYGFELRISKTTPSGEGIDLVRKIGEVDWSGTAIVGLRQTHDSISGPMLQDGLITGPKFAANLMTPLRQTRTAESGPTLQASFEEILKVEVVKGTYLIIATIGFASNSSEGSSKCTAQLFFPEGTGQEPLLQWNSGQGSPTQSMIAAKGAASAVFPGTITAPGALILKAKAGIAGNASVNGGSLVAIRLR